MELNADVAADYEIIYSFRCKTPISEFERDLGRYGGAITTTFLAVREEAEPNGQVRTFLKVGKDGPEEEVETQISWHFTDDDPHDGMQHCYEGLEKMDAMLKELSALGLEQHEA